MSASNKAEGYKARPGKAVRRRPATRTISSPRSRSQASSSVKQTIDDAAGKAKDAAQSVKDKLTGN